MEKTRILLVDDDEDYGVLVRDLLEEGKSDAAFQLRTTPLYEEALSLLKDDSFDVCVLDYSLGERHGLDLLLDIKARDIDVPVIFLTGAGDEELAVSVMRAGASDYLPKRSLSSGLLWASIRYVLSLREGERLRRQAEERYHTVIRTSMDGFLVVDAESGVLETNDAYSRLTGFSREELQGMRIRDLEAIETPGETERHLRDIISTGGDRFETRHRRKDGTVVDVDVSVTYLPEAGGRRMYAFVRDITAQKKMEKELRASLREKELLIKEIHHRVKNNFLTIYSLLRFQSRHLSDSASRELLRGSQDRVRAMSLIHEKLYRSGDLQSIGFPEYIESLARQLFSSYRVEPGSVKLTLDIEDVALDLERMIPCGLILNELIANAFKHAFPEGRGEIRISLRRNSDGACTLTVADDGAGLPSGLDPMKSDSMGLELVGLLSRQLGGTLTVETGAGTTFVLTFPAGTFLAKDAAFRG
jgi:PAS domain S-box-containing protein